VAADWVVPREEVEDPGSGQFLRTCLENQDHLVYFVLNVGDGDTQMVLLPADENGRRRAVVVDVATTRKLPALCRDLAAHGILGDLSGRGVFPVVVGTHPHDDHLGGMPQFIEEFRDQIGEYWEPGYYHSSGSYVETMAQLEEAAHIQRTQPTSGMVRFVGNVKFTALTPGIGLRSRFDSYGISINDASISLKIEFPATRVSETVEDRGSGRRKRSYHRLDAPWSLILGADSQTTSWAQATVDFPQLHPHENPTLYRELRMTKGRDDLRAQVFKVPHHASKHGLNLELVERIAPQLTLISSTNGGGKYNFPHLLAVEAIREALQPSTTKKPVRLDDHQLGIHYTCAELDRSLGAKRSKLLGSMAVVVSPKRGTRLQLWRFGDATKDRVDLERALRLKRVRAPVD
jgi:beta-lactamase superfamily II metal-dependent hydrolase